MVDTWIETDEIPRLTAILRVDVLSLDEVLSRRDGCLNVLGQINALEDSAISTLLVEKASLRNEVVLEFMLWNKDVDTSILDQSRGSISSSTQPTAFKAMLSLCSNALGLVELSSCSV